MHFETKIGGESPVYRKEIGDGNLPVAKNSIGGELHMFDKKLHLIGFTTLAY